MKRVYVVNCLEAGIRSDPEDPNRASDIIGTVKSGTRIQIDETTRYYDWTDHSFYKCKTDVGDGYINTELVNY